MVQIIFNSVAVHAQVPARENMPESRMDIGFAGVL
jgi:hypothetical protein